MTELTPTNDDELEEIERLIRICLLIDEVKITELKSASRLNTLLGKALTGITSYIVSRGAVDDAIQEMVQEVAVTEWWGIQTAAMIHDVKGYFNDK